MNEFSLIARYFAPLAKGFPGADGLLDDAALLVPPAGYELVVTTDTLNEGIHFIGDESPMDIARKLLRVNLSDLAAKGASPWCYMLNLGLPSRLGKNWIAAFAAGLKADQERFGIALAGGDTTNTLTHISLGLTAFGLVKKGMIVRRRGASAGDALYTTGTIGDGYLGLLAARNTLPELAEDEAHALLRRYHLPEPRVALGRELSTVASAAVDISDGLVQDLGQLCRTSGVGAQVIAEHIPASAPAARWLHSHPARLAELLTGGDDYEILCAVPPHKTAAMEALAERHATPLTRIGTMTQSSGLEIIHKNGVPLDITTPGWQHRFH